MEKQEYKNMFLHENEFWWYTTLHSLIVSIIARKKTKDLTIFDAGCGTGRMMELLQAFGDVSGIDYSEDAVYYSKSRGLKKVSQENLNTWGDSKNECYDIITSIDVLYHKAIQNEDDVLQKFHKSLKKDGLLIINLPAFNLLKREHDKVVYTKRRYLKKSFVAQVEKAGFSVKKATYRMPHLFFIIILQKGLRKIFGDKETNSDVQKIPKYINAFFSFLGRIENYYILNLGNIPFGSSLFIVAKKR